MVLGLDAMRGFGKVSCDGLAAVGKDQSPILALIGCKETTLHFSPS